MRRFLSIVLIVMILTSQGLCVVHAHVGMASSHSESHSGRPHFHVHGSHSHGSHADSADHHHDDVPVLPAVTRVPCPLHDSDACYCADSVMSMIQRSSAAETLDFMLLELAVCRVGVVQSEAFSALDGWPAAPRQWSSARTPLYLRDLSIRC
jgi:PhoPQ-activated pathogenicity-related protein